MTSRVASGYFERCEGRINGCHVHSRQGVRQCDRDCTGARPDIDEANTGIGFDALQNCLDQVLCFRGGESEHPG